MGFAYVKVPAIIATGIICFVGGLGLGVVLDANYGDAWKKSQDNSSPEGGQTAEGPMKAEMAKMGKAMKAKMGNGGKGKMGGGMGKMGGGMGGMFRPSSRNQLASLVAKLDLLTQKPLAIHLNDEQRAKLHQELDGLDKKEELSEEEAKKRLDAILEIVKKDKETLESAGYRWPGEGGRRGSGPPAGEANPFRTEQTGQHLKSLQEQLAKTKGP